MCRNTPRVNCNLFIRSNKRTERAWQRAMQYGYFTHSYWAQYNWLVEQHDARFERMLRGDLYELLHFPKQ